MEKKFGLNRKPDVGCMKVRVNIIGSIVVFDGFLRKSECYGLDFVRILRSERLKI